MEEEAQDFESGSSCPGEGAVVPLSLLYRLFHHLEVAWFLFLVLHEIRCLWQKVSLSFRGSNQRGGKGAPASQNLLARILPSRSQR